MQYQISYYSPNGHAETLVNAFCQLLPINTYVSNLEEEEQPIGDIQLVGFDFAGTNLNAIPLKVMEYLDMLDTDLNTVDTVVKTGNPMADAILNSKISLAQSKCITVHCDAHIPVKLKMSELDLCCIIGNLFDNAIEASLSLPEDQRLIRVYMDMKGTQLYISFTNFTASKKLPKLGKRFATTKGDGHGFGLVRIDSIIERLDGYLSRNSEDGAFTTEILIPQM